MYELSNGEPNIDLRWLLKVKGHGQTPKTLKSNISKTVLDREKISIEVSKEVMHRLSNGENIFHLT